MVDARRCRLRPLHDHARQHDRERRAAFDPAQPAHVDLLARVDRHGLRADVRRASDHGRQARRPLRAAQDVHPRPRDLHARLARVRPRAERRLPDRCARRAGRRRCADEPGDALDHHGDVPAEGARAGDRHLGRRLGPRARDRPAARRPDRRQHQLALDLLRQRSGRRRRHRRLAPRDQGVARHLARAEHRPARPRHLGARAASRSATR